MATNIRDGALVERVINSVTHYGRVRYTTHGWGTDDALVVADWYLTAERQGQCWQEGVPSRQVVAAA